MKSYIDQLKGVSQKGILNKLILITSLEIILIKIFCFVNRFINSNII